MHAHMHFSFPGNFLFSQYFASPKHIWETVLILHIEHGQLVL